MKKLILIPILALSLLFSCNFFERCGEYYFIQDNMLVFELHDKETGENVLQFLSNIYDRDSVKVYNETGDIVSTGPDNSGTMVVAVLEDSDINKLNQDITKNFYLYLNSEDTDTIEVTFNLKDPDKCGYVLINTSSISFNDSLYYPQTKSSIPFQIFLKK